MNLTSIDLLGMAFRRLSKRQQKIINMRIIDKMTFQEIGDELSITKMGAQKKYKEIKKKLKKEFTNQP